MIDVLYVLLFLSIIGFLFSVVMIPMRVADIRDILECIDKKLDNFSKMEKNPA